MSLCFNLFSCMVSLSRDKIQKSECPQQTRLRLKISSSGPFGPIKTSLYCPDPDPGSNMALMIELMVVIGLIWYRAPVPVLQSSTHHPQSPWPGPSDPSPCWQPRGWRALARIKVIYLQSHAPTCSYNPTYLLIRLWHSVSSRVKTQSPGISFQQMQLPVENVLGWWKHLWTW